jgi:hypothetical protein
MGRRGRALCRLIAGGTVLSVAIVAAVVAVVFAALALSSGVALAEEKEAKEPVAILELGAAGAWDMHGGSAFGPTAAVEFEPIKNYLVIEAGLTPFFDSSRRADWDFDLLFRHSFALSKTVEFEPGIGPTWTSSGQVGAGVSLEFMIWPWQERKFGWFIDPSYSVTAGRGESRQSLGVAVGLLFGFQ